MPRLAIMGALLILVCFVFAVVSNHYFNEALKVCEAPDPVLLKLACEWCRETQGFICCSRISCATCLYRFAQAHNLNLTWEDCVSLCPPAYPEDTLLGISRTTAWLGVAAGLAGAILLILDLVLNVKKSRR